MQHLEDHNMLADLQNLDNEVSAEYKIIIKSEWGMEYQLIPRHIHHINEAEHAIFTSKAHFISILSGIVHNSPNNLCYLLLPQAELTLNLLHQANLNPNIST